MVNKALRIMEVGFIIKLGFFVCNLHQDISRLHFEQYARHPDAGLLTVYRGQGLSQTDFDQLMKTKGGLLSFNNFLSTSFDKPVAFAFAESNQHNSNSIGVLFKITIDPSILSIPFANLRGISYYQDEEEILFSMHSIFRINQIEKIDESNRLWQVDLSLSSDNDLQLRALTERIKEEIFPHTNGWYRLGQLLIKLGQINQAQEVCEVLLAQTIDDRERANIYHLLGMVKESQEDYEEAIRFFKTSAEINEKILSSTHDDVGSCYNNIGLVYSKMGEHSKALSSHEKALDICQKTLPENHPHLATSYNNIGLLYEKMGEYSKALSYYDKALGIYHKTLPENHPSFAISCGNLGKVFNLMGEYTKALLSYEKALEICQKSLPADHPYVSTSYNNIGLVYEKIGDYSKALLSHEKALEISQKLLAANHPDIARSYNNIGTVYDKTSNYSKALSFYEKTLEIFQKTYPPNHPDLANFYNNIAIVYYKTGDYSKALSFIKLAVDIGQQSLPINHPDLQQYNFGLQMVKEKL